MDKEYWDKFYTKTSPTNENYLNSSFAEFCEANFFKEPMNIVEFGCGAGYDAYYFANNGHNIFAIDQNTGGVPDEIREHDNIMFSEDDFAVSTYNFKGRYNVFYSRFTLHSITQADEDKFLPRVYSYMSDNSLFCVECRTIKDPKFGVGKHICDTTYFNDGHARRFIDSQEFLNKVLSLGFKLKYFNEQDNLSAYKDDNPVLMRIILEK